MAADKIKEFVVVLETELHTTLILAYADAQVFTKAACFGVQTNFTFDIADFLLAYIANEEHFPLRCESEFLEAKAHHVLIHLPDKLIDFLAFLKG